MKTLRLRMSTTIAAHLITGMLFLSSSAFAATSTTVNLTKANAESEVRNIVEPILSKYCSDQCKVLAVESSVEMVLPEKTAPGFEDYSPEFAAEIAPSIVRVKMLVDSMVGPNSKKNLINLIQQHLSGLRYPVQIDTTVANFPQPASAAIKITKLREKVTKEFKDTVEGLFQKFCPDRCLLADFNLQAEAVNVEEAQFNTETGYYQDGEVAIRISGINAAILMDTSLDPRERVNITEMVKLKTNHFKNVEIKAGSMKFPTPREPGSYGEGEEGYGEGGGIGRKGRFSSKEETSTNTLSDSKDSKSTSESNNTNNSNNNSTNSSTNTTQDQKVSNFNRVERIERVEQSSDIKKELEKFKIFGLIFAASVILLLIFVVVTTYRPRKSDGGGANSVQRIFSSLTSDPITADSHHKAGKPDDLKKERNELIAKRYEIDQIVSELTNVFAEMPKVAKHVFTRILTEEGVETTAAYIEIFGEAIVFDMLKDPSLQSDLQELMEYYAKNPVELTDDDKLDLLRKLHNRTISSKMYVLGNRSSNLFDFLIEMDDLQIMDLVAKESLTAKAVVLTQCDPQKRAAIYAKMPESDRLLLLKELSRIDHLPKDYIWNVANALKRKRHENPRLNTESLPGSDVLVNLLEKTGYDIQRDVVDALESTNPDSARTLKNKLVSIDTLRFLRDNQLLEVVLSLRHEELLQFLKGAPEDIRQTIYSKSPKDLVAELDEELAQMTNLSREAYQATERKLLNRIKNLAADGVINLIEVNERMFNEQNNISPTQELQTKKRVS